MLSDNTPKYRREIEVSTASPSAETPRQCLRRVREQSCFSALRAVIWLTVAPGYALALVLALAAAGTGGAALGLGNVGGADAAGLFASPILCALAAVGAFVVTLAVHQAMRILADTADLLIELVRSK